MSQKHRRNSKSTIPFGAGGGNNRGTTEQEARGLQHSSSGRSGGSNSGGGGGAGASAALLAQEAGARVMLITKLRFGDANTMMAQGGIQAADKANDSPARHYLDVLGGGGFTNDPNLVEALVMAPPSQPFQNLAVETFSSACRLPKCAQNIAKADFSARGLGVRGC